MRTKEQWFDILVSVGMRFLFGNPVNRAGFLILGVGLTVLAPSVLIVLLLRWAGIADLELSPTAIAIGFALVFLGLGLIIGHYILVNRPRPPDQLMLDRLRQKLPRDMVDDIRDHQFANGIRLERIRGAIELADQWRSAETRFRDPELQSALKSLVGAAQRLTSIIRQEMRPIDPGSDFMQIRLQEHGYGHERPYDEVGRDLQTNARQINEAYDALIMRAQSLNLKLGAST